MDLGRLAWWRRGKKAWPYDPYERTARALLQEAVSSGASAVVFGVPAGVVWDVDAVNRRHREAMLAFEHPTVPKLTAEDMALIKQFGTLRYRNGYDHMPLFFLVAGAYHEAMPILGANYGRLLTQFHEMLVRIGHTPAARQPARYIELSRDNDGLRKFVEVEMIIERDNTVRVEIVGVRESNECGEP